VSNLLPPFHKVMFSALECHLANDRIADLEAENERLKAERISVDNVMRATLSELGGGPCDDPVILASEVVAEVASLQWKLGEKGLV